MTEHTKIDHSMDNLDGTGANAPGPVVLDKSRPRSEKMATNKVECNACPVLCQITEGRSGACDRWANHDGQLVRLDPVVLMRRLDDSGQAARPRFLTRPIIAVTVPPGATHCLKITPNMVWA